MAGKEAIIFTVFFFFLLLASKKRSVLYRDIWCKPSNQHAFWEEWEEAGVPTDNHYMHEAPSKSSVQRWYHSGMPVLQHVQSWSILNTKYFTAGISFTIRPKQLGKKTGHMISQSRISRCWCTECAEVINILQTDLQLYVAFRLDRLQFIDSFSKWISVAEKLHPSCTSPSIIKNNRGWLKFVLLSVSCRFESRLQPSWLL